MDGGAGQLPDPLFQASSSLVAWARQQGRNLLTQNRGRNMRPEQVAAACSQDMLAWLQEQAGPEVAQGGPEAVVKVRTASGDAGQPRHSTADLMMMS